MKYKELFSGIRKNWVTTVLFAFLIIMILSPSAKSWLLQQFISTGLFNAKIKTEKPEATPASNFTYQNMNGIVSSTASLRGKVVFINFWATWCPPCRAEMPSMYQLYTKLRNDSNIVFIFINEDDNPAKVNSYLQENNMSLPVYTADDDATGNIFGGTLPTTVVMDTMGKIVLKHEGMAQYNTDSFVAQLKALTSRD